MGLKNLCVDKSSPGGMFHATLNTSVKHANPHMFLNQSKSPCALTPFRWWLVVAASVLCGCPLRAGDLSLTLRSNPQLTLTNGVVGNNYSVQYATNLSQPGSWRVLTNLALENSSNTWTDSGANLKATRFYRASLASLQSYTPPPAPQIVPRIFTTNDVLGDYQRLPVQNSWHVGSIIRKPGSATLLQWTNQAGVKWNLTPAFTNQLLLTDGTNPYQNSPGGQNFTLAQVAGQLAGFYFNGELYSKVGAQVPTFTSDSMHGYISTYFTATPPTNYAFGFSFYSAIWSLLDQPLSGFQVGLPGTWVIPDNRDFFQPLLPADNPMRMASPERGPYWRDVFQTIEGSGGSWATTRFPSATPKYRMNGSIDGYIHEVSSPGWGFGQTTALPTNAMGLAQLSNRLLVPPDGLTFNGQPGGEFLGYAWMALPLVPSTNGIGDQSWTCFINAANYKGVLAFYVPQLWTRYSEIYTTIVGRGLDNRPGIANPFAMEFGGVPMKTQTNGSGQVYARIPRLLFPTNGADKTYLATDMTLYSKAAMFTPVQNWFAGGAPAPGRFNTNGSYLPQIGVNPIGFSGGASNLSVSGFNTVVQSAVLNTPGGGKAFGLQWTGGGTPGVFPEYFRVTNNAFSAIPSTQLPADVVLSQVDFAPAGPGGPYTSPASWNTPAPSTTTNVATLSDGSKISYAWYRFVDQPAVQGFVWTAAQKQLIQSRVQQIHTNWSTTANFMPPPTGGILATLDPALIVTPPPGMEAGYVPIVIQQWKP